MTAINDGPLFDAIRAIKKAGKQKTRLTQAEVDRVKAIVAVMFAPPAATPTASTSADGLTVRAMCELVGHEAIVREWYLDNAKPPRGTWGIGVTNASGHGVDRYKDNPQPIEHCLEVFVWLVRTRYLPPVLKAFAGYPLTEAQIAAALSFEYNTGAIANTEWVPMVLAGQMAAARTFLETHYLNGGVLQDRRKKEAALFFDGAWSGDGTANVYPVRKPSYTPDFAHPTRIDITAPMAAAMGAGA